LFIQRKPLVFYLVLNDALQLDFEALIFLNFQTMSPGFILNITPLAVSANI